MPISFKPMHNKILVKRTKSDSVTKGGIMIPDVALEKPQQGEVVAVGPGNRTETGKLIPLELSVGDQILFGKYSGVEIKIEGEDYTIMQESDVLGVL